MISDSSKAATKNNDVLLDEPSFWLDSIFFLLFCDRQIAQSKMKE
jgi:hypothetical protein